MIKKEIVEALKKVTNRYRNPLSATGYSLTPFAALRLVCERITNNEDEAFELYASVVDGGTWNTWNPMWGYSKDQYDAYKRFFEGDEIAKKL